VCERERETFRNVESVVGLRSSTSIPLRKIPFAGLQFDEDLSMHKVELLLGL
jgi:hypothetical protein